MKHLLLLLLIAVTLFSCTKEERCYQFTLGIAGEYYEPIETNGLPSVIYVEDGLIIQEICK